MKLNEDELNKIIRFFKSKSGLNNEVWTIDPHIFKIEVSEERKEIEVIISRNETTYEIKLFDKDEILTMGEK